MKLRTSFFNRAVLKKDITRFAPVWALYTVALVVMFLSAGNDNTVLIASNTREMLGTTAIFSLIYGGVCAIMLFGDLFQSRMCNALHTMPLRREGWFLTHICAGMLFCVVPNVAGGLLFAAMLQEYWYMALLWLAVAVLEFVFFFGLAVFAVMCAGNRLGMVAVYGVINCFSVLVYALVKEVYEPLLYGIEQYAEPYTFYCPVYTLSSERFFMFDYEFENGVFSNGRIAQFFPQTWWYAVVVAVIGVGLMAAAVLLYRRRKLERAGDFLALRGLEPVFLVICTLACGVFLYILSSLFGFAVSYVLMGLGIVVGFFGGLMLIKRTVRVFRVKSLVGFGVFMLVFVGSLLLTRADVAGITRYVPQENEIAAMRVYRDNEFHVYADETQDCYELTSAQEIQVFRGVHEQLMTERGEKTDGACWLYIHYFLKDGRQVKRYYSIDENTGAYDTLKAYFSDHRYVFNNKWDQVYRSITSIDVNLAESYAEEEGDMPMAISMESVQISDPEKIAAFLDAVKKDCDAGNMAQAHTFHVGEDYIGWFYMGSNVVEKETGQIIRNGEIFKDLTVYSCAEHTMALLKQWMKEEQTQ